MLSRFKVVDEKEHKLRSNKSASRHLHHAWLSLFPPSPLSCSLSISWGHFQLSYLSFSLHIYSKSFPLPPHLSVLFCWSVSSSVHRLNSLLLLSTFLPVFSHFTDHHYCGEHPGQENTNSLPCRGSEIGADSLLREKKGQIWPHI